MSAARRIVQSSSDSDVKVLTVRNVEDSAHPDQARRSIVGNTLEVEGSPASDAAPRRQIMTSPYYGSSDFSCLADDREARLDMVSLADLLRNGFVYPPHSIFQDVKLVTYNFDPLHDMHHAPQFRANFRDVDRSREQGAPDQDWVGTYHRLLCEAMSAACEGMHSPWLLQSGGKDSTTLAIAAAEVRPDTVCATYLGGREENEVDSARAVANTLGLQHETLVCDPARAYDRYLAIVDHMPLLTADFALLSYVDMATEIAGNGGDGVLDGLGSDNYFGLLVGKRQRWASALARSLQFSRDLTQLPLIRRNFELCYMLSTLQMEPAERVFPGSRFTDLEVDALFGRSLSTESKQRLALFREEMASADSLGEWWAMVSSIGGSVGAVGKGLYTTAALSLRVAYPFCDRQLREWVFRKVPPELLMDFDTMTNKVLVRNHISTRFAQLPYVARKGSFRFDLRGLARCRFQEVHAYAVQMRDVLPGAVDWLEHNRNRLDNKYHASKFYLLAIVLPWIARHGKA